MVSLECDERCANYGTNLHVCYDNIITADYTGTTYKGFYADSAPVAVKTIFKCEETEQYFHKETFRYLMTNSKFNRNENLVHYFDMDETVKLRFVVMERYDTDLRDMQTEKFRKSDRLKFIKSICQAVHILHSEINIVHGKINPNNVLLWKNQDGSYTAKLADFGISKTFSDDCTTIDTNGTQNDEWMSPRFLRANDCGDIKYKASAADDIFSLGMLIYYIYTNGKHPFGNPSWRIYSIRYNRIDSDDILEENFAFQNLMRAMTNRKPKERPTIQQVINHPFFWSYEFNFHFIRDVYSRLGSFCQFQDNLESRFDIMNDFSGGWNKALDPEWIAYLQKQRAKTSRPYKFKSFVSLLGFICENFENRSDWANETKLVPLLRNDEPADAAIDELSYMRYFMRKFPKLILVLATTDGIESLRLNPDFILPSQTTFDLGPSDKKRGWIRKVLSEKCTKTSKVVLKRKIRKEKKRQIKHCEKNPRRSQVSYFGQQTV
ncbi:serine/threonine-protein kinase/endoribonuclease IRE1-like [Bradysia coprophila]|uniref:serine/threonine-protein kinase/endoribonuclease IRE1-like n=1 Tax=Bradysia coprophila TaxID=38358 RepID=UPI00187D872B|nr:serine/threonine-protein kinase/endoribonuclease IRE1-like [Bradysia coprophila]